MSIAFTTSLSSFTDYDYAGSFGNFNDENPWVMAVILILFSIPMCLAGQRYFPHLIAVFACLVTFVTLIMLASAWEWFDCETWLQILQIVAYFGIGLAAAWAVRRTLRIGVFLLGTVAGALIGFLFYGAVLTGINADWLYITVIVAFAVAGAMGSWKRPDLIIRFGTSFIGAYMLARGLSFWIGGFPSEADLY
mmetsp:Transcript_27517/g.19902  ORF Transcript_27517/g.19902 Transcript_27517/m.19902 type:complete len:193 (-) Transcript_27517:259-837(-)